MFLTVEIKRSQFYGDKLIKLKPTNGYLWRSGKKFFGIEVEKQDRLFISDETIEGIDKQLEQYAKQYGIKRIETAY
jgi:hypothetical protein